MCWLQQSAALWHYPTFLLPPLLLIACLECFAGYHAWRFLVGLNGAILGFIAGVFLCMLSGAAIFVLIGALLGAIAGAALFTGIAPLGTTVFAFGSAASFIILVGRVAGCPPACYLPLACLAGIAAVVAALASPRPMIIALTALGGAQQIACAWCAYHLPYDAIPVPDVVIPSEWALFVIVAALGLLVQFTTSGKRAFTHSWGEPRRA